jgi:CheY-like chemotaxis protein
LESDDSFHDRHDASFAVNGELHMDSSESPVVRKLRVLVADDEPAVREFTSSVLQHQGFVVLSVCDGTEALTLSGNRAEHIDLLVTDVRMGDGLNGIELAEEMLRGRADLAVLVTSGLPDSATMAAVRGYAFLRKPFLPAQLAKGVQEVLAAKISSQPAAKPRHRESTG